MLDCYERDPVFLIVRFFPDPTRGEEIPHIVEFDIVTENAAVGDGGNAWGDHFCRIVRTSEGVFTAYTVPGQSELLRQWRLAWRNKGVWEIIAGGISGREPVNLLASPDGTLHVIGWPHKRATIWSGKPENGKVEMTPNYIPGLSPTNWPYGSAGIDAQGNICVLSDFGDGGVPGTFRWAYYDALAADWAKSDPPQTHWVSRQTDIDFRYCYTFVFPQIGGGIALVSNRDVEWDRLGYERPEGGGNWIFNAFRYWYSPEPLTRPLKERLTVEEPPTEHFPLVKCAAMNDVYIDTQSRVHILYQVKGESTNGKDQNRHIIISLKGEKLYQQTLPEEIGRYCSILQNARGSFYILGSSGLLYPAGDNGRSLGEPIQLDLRGYEDAWVRGYSMAAPRTGTQISDVMDFVSHSEGGKKTIYFRLQL